MATDTARKLRKNPTDAERKLWRALKSLDRPHTHFRRQVAIGPFIADFACHAARLIVEVDGGQHNEDVNLAADAERTAFLETRGYKVLRFWNPDVLRDLDSVLETIRAELDARLRKG